MHDVIAHHLLIDAQAATPYSWLRKHNVTHKRPWDTGVEQEQNISKNKFKS